MLHGRVGKSRYRSKGSADPGRTARVRYPATRTGRHQQRAGDQAQVAGEASINKITKIQGQFRMQVMSHVIGVRVTYGIQFVTLLLGEQQCARPE